MCDPNDLTRTVRTRIRVCECGCWYWTASTDTAGYGKVKIRNVTVIVHRYVWEHFHGPITDDLTVDHLNCPTRRCVNPGHMQLVSRSENSTRANETRYRDRKFTADGVDVDRRTCDICVPGSGSLTPDDYRKVPHTRSQGTNNHSVKLTEEQVLIIASARQSISALARYFNVDRATIRDIRTGKTWSHLTGMSADMPSTQTTQKETETT